MLFSPPKQISLRHYNKYLDRRFHPNQSLYFLWKHKWVAKLSPSVYKAKFSCIRIVNCEMQTKDIISCIIYKTKQNRSQAYLERKWKINYNLGFKSYLIFNFIYFCSYYKFKFIIMKQTNILENNMKIKIFTKLVNIALIFCRSF